MDSSRSTRSRGASAPPLDFRTLGGLSVWADGPGGATALDLGARKQRAVLAVLLLEPDRVVPVERIVELVWPGEDPDKARAILQSHVSRLRTILEPHRRPRDPARVLLTQAPGYRLAVDRQNVDLYRFTDAIRRGSERLRDGDLDDAGRTLGEALETWTGPLLPELADEPFVTGLAERVTDLRLTGIEAMADVQLRRGDADAAVRRLSAEVLEHPTRERLHALLSLALYRSGRQADALRVIDQCRRALADQAGLALGAELRRLEADVLSQATTLDWTPPAGPGQVGGQATGEPVLVGRAAELGVLRRALDDVAHGGDVFALILGEAGIGKSRLAQEIVDEAKARGLYTAWVRCPENRVTPPFWPMHKIEEQLTRAGLDTSSLDGGREILQDLHARHAADPSDPAASALKTAMHDAVMDTVLADPVVVVLDDLQWADVDTLRLLETVAATMGTNSPALMIATVRPVEDDAPGALVDCLSAISRSRGHVRVELAGLSVDDVRTWIGTRASGRASEETTKRVAAIVHERTAGNALFVHEIIELAVDEATGLDDRAIERAGSAIPTAVQFVVRGRVSRLPPATQRLLSTAAVVGAAFAPASVAAATDVPLPEVLHGLEPALDAGLVVVQGTDLAFSHALVADALVGEVNAARRAAIHAAVAQALVADLGADYGPRASAVAHHALAGMLAGTGELAIDASRQAAEFAQAQHADGDAAVHWSNVASALLHARPHDEAALVDAHLQLARALLRTGQVPEAQRPLREAIDRAARAGLVAHADEAAALLSDPNLVSDL